MNVMALWSHAGGAATCEAAGTWYAAVPQSEWPKDAVALEQIGRDSAKPFGDRRQELVFIGADIDRRKIEWLLDGALLTYAELALGFERWAELSDPFPQWQQASGEEAWLPEAYPIDEHTPSGMSCCARAAARRHCGGGRGVRDHKQGCSF